MAPRILENTKKKCLTLKKESPPIGINTFYDCLKDLNAGKDLHAPDFDIN